MRLVVDIDLEGDAFQEDAGEVARILRRLSGSIGHDPLVLGTTGPLFDINGNTCGTWVVVP